MFSNLKSFVVISFDLIFKLCEIRRLNEDKEGIRSRVIIKKFKIKNFRRIFLKKLGRLKGSFLG